MDWLAGYPHQEMDVIPSAIHAKRGASNLTDDTSEVGVEILLELGLDQSAPLFGAENEMHQ